MNSSSPPVEVPVNLDGVPYTVPYSRLFVRAQADALTVYRAAYERPLGESVVVGSLRLHDGTGTPLRIVCATPFGVEFDGGVALVVTPDDMVSLGPLPSGTRVTGDFTLPAMEAELVSDRLAVPEDATTSTTGGVTASFATIADVSLAEPGALIGFAGPRVIQQTIRQSLPEGFQRSEFLLEHGMLDDVVDRREQREYLARLLRMLLRSPRPETGEQEGGE